MESNTADQEEAKRALELVRSDLNLEKWQIFAVRKRRDWREIVKKENDREMKLIIGKTEDGREVGTLTAEDGKVFYGLLRLWEKAGKPDGEVEFTIRQLIEVLKLPDNAQVYRAIKLHLARLAQIPLTFIESYRRSRYEDTVTVYFTILDTLGIFERKYWRPGDKYFKLSRFKFHNEIMRTIKNKYVKPLPLNVLRELKSDIAFILYRYLDRVMFTNTHYELDLKLVAELCGMSEQAEVWRIKQRVSKALKELVGKNFTHGKIIKAEIVPSQSGSGWKCVFEKGKQDVIDQTQAELICGEKTAVFFKYKGQANEVRIAGSFNNWKCEKMGRIDDEWSLPFELLPGKYYYKFVVDGEWICDPKNPVRERDEQGNENSVLVVEGG